MRTRAYYCAHLAFMEECPLLRALEERREGVRCAYDLYLPAKDVVMACSMDLRRSTPSMKWRRKFAAAAMFHAYALMHLRP